VTNLITERIDAFCQQRRVQASSLIVTIFGDAVLPRGGRVWLGSLIRLLEPMQLNERLVRTSVFRLRQLRAYPLGPASFRTSLESNLCSSRADMG